MARAKRIYILINNQVILLFSSQSFLKEILLHSTTATTILLFFPPPPPPPIVLSPYRNPYKARHRRICAIWTSWSVAYTSFSTEPWTFKEWHEENLYSKSQITVLCGSSQTKGWQLTRFSRIPISAGIWLRFHIQRAVSLGDASFIARQKSFENWCQCCTRCVSWRSCYIALAKRSRKAVVACASVWLPIIIQYRRLCGPACPIGGNK